MSGLVPLVSGQYAVVDVSSAYSLPRFQSVKVDKVTDKLFQHGSSSASRRRVVFAGTEIDCDSLAAVLRASVAEEWKATCDLRAAAKEARQCFVNNAIAAGQRS